MATADHVLLEFRLPLGGAITLTLASKHDGEDAPETALRPSAM
jgi:hypothetical protein